MRPIEGPAPDESPLRDYLRVIRRRKWIVVAAGRAGRRRGVRGLAVGARGVRGPGADDPHAAGPARRRVGQTPADAAQADRIVKTMADLARVPAVAARTLAAAGVHDLTPAQCSTRRR
jgi:hypothetical protein